MGTNGTESGICRNPGCRTRRDVYNEKGEEQTSPERQTMPCQRTDLARLPTAKGVPMISKEMTIAAIISRYPETMAVFRRHGLDCSECQLAEVEELEHGAGVHKIDLATLIQELNTAVRSHVPATE